MIFTISACSGLITTGNALEKESEQLQLTGEELEKILREELKNVPDKSPLILDGPTYIGVRSLDENGVVLRMASRCHEPCRRKVEREVNRIVYRIFQKNNISVPYPQVTFHQGDDNLVER